MFGIDECGDAAFFLGFGDDVQAERGFAGGFRAEDFDDAAAGHAFAAEGDIQREGAGGDAVDIERGVAIHIHDGALAVGFFDLSEGAVEGLVAGPVSRAGAAGVVSLDMFSPGNSKRA